MIFICCRKTKILLQKKVEHIIEKTHCAQLIWWAIENAWILKEKEPFNELFRRKKKFTICFHINSCNLISHLYGIRSKLKFDKLLPFPNNMRLFCSFFFFFYRSINVNEISKYFNIKWIVWFPILLKCFFFFISNLFRKIIDIFLSQQLWLSEVNDIFTLNVNLLQKHKIKKKCRQSCMHLVNMSTKAMYTLIKCRKKRMQITKLIEYLVFVWLRTNGI